MIAQPPRQLHVDEVVESLVVQPVTQVQRGSVEFQTLGSPAGVGGVGLRFNGAAFTSTNPFQKPSWAQ